MPEASHQGDTATYSRARLRCGSGGSAGGRLRIGLRNRTSSHHEQRTWAVTDDVVLLSRSGGVGLGPKGTKVLREDDDDDGCVEGNDWRTTNTRVNNQSNSDLIHSSDITTGHLRSVITSRHEHKVRPSVNDLIHSSYIIPT